MLAHGRIVGEGAQEALAKIVFWAACPALLVVVISEAELALVMSRPFLAQAAAVVAAVTVVGLAARHVFGHDLSGATVSAGLVGYVNAVNLGLPLAIFALDDPAVIVPMIVLQLIFVQPIMILILSQQSGRGGSSGAAALRTLANPMLLGTGIGIALAAFQWTIPGWLAPTVDMLADMTIPAILLGFGISLRLGPRMGSGGQWTELIFINVVKLVLMPVVGLVVGHLIGLRGNELLGVAVMTAMPSAQNVFIIATEYNRNTQLARDVTLTSTALSFPVITIMSLVLG